MANTPRAKEIGFDPGRLNAMIEPLNVRVEKVKGNLRMPVELPPKDGAAPGSNWSRDEVLKLEAWLLNEWTGGGYYRAIVTDAGGNRMEWEFVYDPKLYPERVPPNHASAAVLPPMSAPAPAPAPHGLPPQAPPPMMAAPPPAPAPVGYPMGSSVNFPPLAATVQGYPFGYGPAPQPAPPMTPWGAAPGSAPGVGPWGGGPSAPQVVGYGPQGQPIYGLPSPYPPGFAPGALGFTPRFRGGGGFDDDFNRRDRWRDRDEEEGRAEKKRLEEEVRRLERERQEAEHKAALERIQQEHARQIVALQQEIRLANDRRGVEENETLRREREERERLERQREQERIELRFQALQETIAKLADVSRGRPEDDKIREMQDELRRTREEQQRERERMELIQREERMRQEIQTQAQRTEQMLREAQSNRPDPILAFMQENARVQAENMREIARLQQMGADRMAQMMMPPQAIAALLKDSNSGADVLLKNVIGSFSGIFDTFRHAVEQITNLSGGGGDPPAVRLLQEGVGRASELAEKYLQMKRDQVVSEAKAKAVAAQAQAQVATVQAQAQRGWSPPPATMQSGLAGTVPPSPAAANGPAATAANGTAPDESMIDSTTGQAVGRVIPMKRPPTDEEMFGMALESVRRLRLGVQSYLDANGGQIVPDDRAAVDGNGKIVGLSPSLAIDAILQGVNFVTQKQIVIPVFTLFEQGRYADLMDVMLPDAPQVYRDECVRILHTEIEVDDASGAEGGVEPEATP